MTSQRLDVDRFDRGMDLRKSAAVADANRLVILQNCTVTDGYAVEKRAGSTALFGTPDDTVGIASIARERLVFHHQTSQQLVGYRQVALTHPTTPSLKLKAVHFAQKFAGYLYAVAEYTDGSVWHHYLDGSAVTAITDANCPHAKSVVAVGSKLYALGGSVVRYCSLPNPASPGTSGARNWTTANDAGFLPTGDSRQGDSEATGLGVFNKFLAVFFIDGVQLWSVDPDPSLTRLYSNVESAGTVYPHSIRATFSDLFYLSAGGFRSVSVQGVDNSERENDVGSPIDKPVQAALAKLAADGTVWAGFYSSGGQYWCVVGDTVFAFKFSRSAKVTAWAFYQFPFPIVAIAEEAGTLLLRTPKSVVAVDRTRFDDVGDSIPTRVKMPFLDCKASGSLKQFQGFDAAVEGDFEVAFGWDPNDDTQATEPMAFYGDTRPLNLQPVEVCAVAIQPDFTSNHTGPFRLDKFSLYYNALGPV